MAELMIFAPSKGGDGMGKMMDKETGSESGGPEIDAAKVLLAAIKSGIPAKVAKAFKAMNEACSPMSEGEDEESETE